jgi:MFS family permease
VKEPATDQFDRRLVPPLLLGSVLNPINSSMIAVALVPIGAALGAPPSQTVWLVSGLYLATAVGQPVVGRLVDKFGPRRLYLVATALVGVAGVIGMLAPNLGVLVGSRILLGFGTCAAYPAAMSLIRSEADRTGVDSPQGVLTALTVANQVLAVIGPSVGGLLIGVGGWRAIFSVNIPLSIACLVLGWLHLPRGRATADLRRNPGLDALGMALFAGMLTSALLFLMEPALGRWWLLLLAVLLGVGFARRELGQSDAFIDLRVLGGNAPLLATYLRQTVNYTASYALLYGYVQWLEDGRGLDPTQAGLLLLPVFATGLLTTIMTGRHREVRAKLIVGALAIVLGNTVVLMAVGAHTSIWLLAVVGAIAGITQGLVGLANQNALYHQAEPERMGASAGLLRTFMYAGALIAAAAVAATLRDRATTAGLHELSAFMLGCGVLLLVLTLPDRSLRRIGIPTTSDPRDPAHAADRS